MKCDFKGCEAYTHRKIKCGPIEVVYCSDHHEAASAWARAYAHAFIDFCDEWQKKVDEFADQKEEG
jgi:hypothetical protein